MPSLPSPEQETQVLGPDAIISLIEIDLNPLGIPIVECFCNVEASTEPGAGVMLGGVKYTSWPMSLKGFKSNSEGSLPKPQIEVGNVNNLISTLLLLYKPYKATVRRRRIYRRYLDDGTDPNPLAQFEPQEYVLDRWDRNDINCVLHLATELEYLNLEIPARRIVDLRRTSD